MTGIRLSKLPDRIPVKITIGLPPDLSQSLEEYGRFYAQAYERSEPMAELIPAIVAAFLRSDKGFARWLREHERE